MVRSKSHLQHRSGRSWPPDSKSLCSRVSQPLSIPLCFWLQLPRGRLWSPSQQSPFTYLQERKPQSPAGPARASSTQTESTTCPGTSRNKGRPSKSSFTTLQSGLMESQPGSLAVDLGQNSPSLLKTFSLRTSQFITVFKH